MRQVEDKWIVRGLKSNPQNSVRLIIKGDKKEEILKILSYLGFNKMTLFPEIEKVAEYIKSKY